MRSVNHSENWTGDLLVSSWKITTVHRTHFLDTELFWSSLIIVLLCQIAQQMDCGCEHEHGTELYSLTLHLLSVDQISFFYSLLIEVSCPALLSNLHKIQKDLVRGITWHVSFPIPGRTTLSTVQQHLPSRSGSALETWNQIMLISDAMLVYIYVGLFLFGVRVQDDVYRPRSCRGTGIRDWERRGSKAGLASNSKEVVNWMRRRGGGDLNMCCVVQVVSLFASRKRDLLSSR